MLPATYTITWGNDPVYWSNLQTHIETTMDTFLLYSCPEFFINWNDKFMLVASNVTIIQHDKQKEKHKQRIPVMLNTRKKYFVTHNITFSLHLEGEKTQNI